MNYNFVENLRKHLVSIKVNNLGKHVVLNVPFYGGFLCLDMNIKDGFFMNAKCTINVLNETRRINNLEFKFGTADEISKKIAEVLVI